jgi:hypothetical protein
MVPAYSKEVSPFKPKLSLKFSGGWSSIPIGDMNTALRSFNSMPRFQYWRANYPNLITGEIKTLNTNIVDWSLELRLDFAPRFGLAIGASAPYKKSNEGMINWTMLEGQRHEFTIRPRIEVAPSVFWSFYYALSSRPKLDVLLDVGMGIHTAKMSKYYKLEVFPVGYDSDWGAWTWESKRSSSVGIHAGLEIDYKLTNALALVIEAQKRFAWVSDFYGTRQDEGKYEGIYYSVTDAVYYYTRLEFYTGDRYADITVMTPPGNLIEFPADIRKATLNLGEFSVKVGIKLTLF